MGVLLAGRRDDAGYAQPAGSGRRLAGTAFGRRERQFVGFRYTNLHMDGDANGGGVANSVHARLVLPEHHSSTASQLGYVTVAGNSLVHNSAHAGPRPEILATYIVLQMKPATARA